MTTSLLDSLAIVAGPKHVVLVRYRSSRVSVAQRNPRYMGPGAGVHYLELGTGEEVDGEEVNGGRERVEG